MVTSAAEQKASAPKTSAKVEAIAEEEITFTYCTEFIVQKDKSITRDPIKLRAYLETIGDCVVVVDDEDIIKVHVHTDNPGNAIQEGLKFGMLVNIKIDNMREQTQRIVEEETAPAKTAKGEAIKPAKPENEYGFVVVGAGEGICQLFSDLGADQLVEGGQTMNPSTDDILRAVEATPAKTVFVLPNNKNIIMAAEQAIPLATRKVCVLPTRTIPQGISAMLVFDESASASDNQIEMMKAVDHVGSGQITFAARDSQFDGHNIKEGELLALNNGKIAFTDKNDALAKCVAKLTKQLCTKETAFITLIYGCDVSSSKAEQVLKEVKEKVSKDIEINLVKGDQPVYYFLISVE
jgi:DAK2 domain fusion protein YloV